MLDASHAAAVHRGSSSYSDLAPFDPHGGHDEYHGPLSATPNAAYDGVRDVLSLLYPEGERFGTGRAWNPLQELIRPGQTVFVKPNLVDHQHRFGGDVWSVITHPSVVRAVADYVALALRGEGRIVIGDNPHIDCDWTALSKLYRMDLVTERIGEVYGIDTSFIDLRSWHMPDLTKYGWRHAREALAGDPAGHHVVDVHNSYLDDANWWLFRGTFNERWETLRAHRGAHRYSFSGTIANADTYVSVPKLKSHAKVGATVNIKGLIGTIIDKNSLVHWSIGYPRFGGDEYPDPEHWSDYPRLYWQHLVTDALPSRVQLGLRSRLGNTAVGERYSELVTTTAQRQRLLRGAWDGNDTTWRMTADVYEAFIGAPVTRPRPTLSIVDGIVGGDTDGPHFPHRVTPGVIVGAENLLVADLVSTRLMDFDSSGIRYLQALSESHGIGKANIAVSGIEGEFFAPHRRYLGFRPPNRWPNLSLANLEPGGDLIEESLRAPKAKVAA